MLLESILVPSLNRPPSPPNLEIGIKVPDHRRQRCRKQIFPDVAKGKKWCFHPPLPPPTLKVARKREGVGVWPVAATPPREHHYLVKPSFSVPLGAGGGVENPYDRAVLTGTAQRRGHHTLCNSLKITKGGNRAAKTQQK